MTTEKLTCLINKSNCGREAGNPICPKCGMDERVVYPGQEDLNAALLFAKTKYKDEKSNDKIEFCKTEKVAIKIEPEFKTDGNAQRSELNDGRQVKIIKRIRNGWIMSGILSLFILIASLMELLLGHDLVFMESMEGADHLINFTLVIVLILLSFGVACKSRIASVILFSLLIVNSAIFFYTLSDLMLDSVVFYAIAPSSYISMLSALLNIAITWVAFNAMRSCITWRKYSYTEALSGKSIDQGLHILSIFLCMTILPMLIYTVAASVWLYLKDYWLFFLVGKLLTALCYFTSLVILWGVARWRAMVAFGLMAYLAFVGVVELNVTQSILKTNLMISISGILIGFIFVIWETFFQERVGVYLYRLLPERIILGKVIRWEFHPKVERIFLYHMLLGVFILLAFVLIK